MKKCETCGMGFENHSLYANHIRWAHKDNIASIAKNKENAINRYKKINGEIIEKIVSCHICGKSFSIKEHENKCKEKYYCSVSCSNTRNHSIETRNKMSLSLKQAWKTNSNLQLTTSSHLKNKRFSSKNELIIRDFFKSEYPDDNWTFGGNLNIDEYRISRDLYSNKLKVCIEYDGIWHFKNIHNQLKEKQDKDAALEKWCILNSYRLIRISENVFTQNINDKLKQLADEVYNGNQQIVKYY
ncbi:MAG: hypothetical protein WC979_02025 [Candidatus Pacearchaeota archaeon]|jgi:very-short-patch-repair endonuclease|nr:hypothetical protein [Clostridia bacterium]